MSVCHHFSQTQYSACRGGPVAVTDTASRRGESTTTAASKTARGATASASCLSPALNVLEYGSRVLVHASQHGQPWCGVNRGPGSASHASQQACPGCAARWAAQHGSGPRGTITQKAA